jgi:formate hydrogenlyase transcriptional activator
MPPIEPPVCKADSSRRYQEILASSLALKVALAFLPNAAATNLTILITGERGTGKELLACAIHRLSHRSTQSFVRIRCAAMGPDRIASELFGGWKGGRPAKTQPRFGRLPLAEGGTIFLEGVDDLAGEAQHALLRALREMESGCGDRNRCPRLIATTRRSLERATNEGTFVRGLFFRLNEFTVSLPPLRERKEDIPALARHFLAEYFLSRRRQKQGRRPVLTERAIHQLQAYPWPGNLRQLQSVMERLAALSEASILSVDAKWIPWDSVQARSRGASASRAAMPNEAELLEAALMEMLDLEKSSPPGS